MASRMLSAPLILVLVAGLGGCDPAAFAVPGSDAPSPVSDEIRALAAPYQDVETARILPADGCYWYEHRGPVETTLLPLLTREGRPICTAASVEAKAATPAAAAG
ncbi:hypothetical protein [Poseidonocella sp. HB161398]|uniref:hypothetical protein n=1 Tax=Poseidonocella sp. HB161398 TaxID=2320855 RepID=UPI001107EC1C|nr:hypothetical protein [Poseidonocella sp. HB161398]